MFIFITYFTIVTNMDGLLLFYIFLCLYKESVFTLYGVLFHLRCYFKSDLMNKVFFLIKVLKKLYGENLLRKKFLIVVRKANVFVGD